MFFAMPWIVNGLGEIAFAILSLVWTVITYFSLWDLGIGRAVTKFVAEKRAAGKTDQVVSVVHISTAIGLALGIFFGLLIFLFAPQIGRWLFKVPAGFNETVLSALSIVALSMPVLLLQSVFRGVVMGFDRFDLSNLIQIMNGILQWGGALVLVLLHFNVLSVIAFVMISRLITTIVLWLMVSHIIGWKAFRRNFELSLLKEILVFGGWAMVSQVVSPILQYAERFMLSALIATGIVTFYVVPYEATSKMLFISIGLVSALFPAMSEIHGLGGVNQDFKKLYTQSERILIFVFLPICAFLITFAPDILKAWMGNDFARKAFQPFEILSLAFVINSFAQLPFTILQAVGRADITGKIHLIELPIHILFAFIMIRSFGLVGAAVATLFRIVLDAGLLYSMASKKLGLEVGIVKDFRKKFALPTLCLTVGVAGSFFFKQAIIIKGIFACISLLLYAVVVFRFSLEDNEKRVLTRLVLGKANA